MTGHSELLVNAIDAFGRASAGGNDEAIDTAQSALRAAIDAALREQAREIERLKGACGEGNQQIASLCAERAALQELLSEIRNHVEVARDRRLRKADKAKGQPPTDYHMNAVNQYDDWLKRLDASL